MDQNQLSIDDIQQKITAAMGITTEPNEEQQNLIDKATETLLESIFLETIDKLSEEDNKAYLELIEKETDPEAISKFLTEKIPSHTAILQKLVDDFITEMKASAITS